MLLQSPYIMTQANGSVEGGEQLEISIDGGKSWKTANLKDFGAAVGGQVAALARLTFKNELRNLRLQATVQNNPFALPFLSPGRNTVTVSVADPAALDLNGGGRRDLPPSFYFAGWLSVFDRSQGIKSGSA